MSLRTLLGVLVGATLALPLGCGSDKTTLSDPLATGDGFCKQWAKNACTTKVVEACAATDVAACQDKQAAFCGAYLPDSGYKKTNARSCLDAVKAAYSDGALTATELGVVRDFGAPCDKLVEGPAAAGDSCVTDTDCDTLTGHACVTSPSGSICAIPELRTGGQSCGQPEQTCADGFYCAPLGTGGDAGSSMACIESPQLGDACTATLPCGVGLVCTGTDPNTTCTAKASKGGACAANGQCLSGICTLAGGQTTGVCVDTVVISAAEPVCADLR